MLDRYPSGNLGIMASIVHEYRSSMRYPTALGETRLSSGYRTLSTVLEIRVLNATVSWQFRKLPRRAILARAVVHHAAPDKLLWDSVGLCGLSVGVILRRGPRWVILRREAAPVVILRREAAPVVILRREAARSSS
jgi:hypothetical protein